MGYVLNIDIHSAEPIMHEADCINIDDETNLEEMEKNVRAIEMDGLVWGASKLVPIGFGIRKLQINLVVEDEKVSLDELQQLIEQDEDHVQSTDIVSFSLGASLQPPHC